jgi:hypothetical protein
MCNILYGSEEENGENLTAPLNISYSRSLRGSGFMKLSLGAEPLEMTCDEK